LLKRRREIVLTGVNLGDFGKGEHGDDEVKISSIVRALDRSRRHRQIADLIH
jgi:hypothetical protein